MLASGGGDGSVILWDPQSRQQIEELLGGYLGGLASIAFSPDGKMLASASWEGTVILWDVDIKPWKERACRTASRNLTRSEWAQYLKNEPYHKTCPNMPEGH
jgi:WD40 repeat protein